MTPLDEDTTITIPLDKGQSAVISAFQYHLVKDITWHAKWNQQSATYYAHGNIKETRPGRTNKFRCIAMHRILCGILDDRTLVVHHRDRDGLNNTQKNMGVMTPFEHDRLHGRSNGNPIAPHVLAGYVSIWRRVGEEEKQAYRASWPAEIPFGYCQCGCGTKTEPAPKTDRHYNWLEGEPKPMFYPHKRKPKTRGVRVRSERKKRKFICGCGGRKARYSAMCNACQMIARRPPVDPETYYDEGRPYRRVPCTQGQYTLVSADKYDLAASLPLVGHFDSSSGKYYVSTRYNGKPDKLHRILANAPKGIKIDHANRDPLDNRDWNLRPADESQQMANQNRQKRNTSGYVGVWFRKERNRWCGQVTFRGKQYFTKHCMTVREAVIERNNLALEVHGEFAILNEIPEAA